VALLASSGRTGRESALEQQQRLLSGLNVPESEKAAKIALQQRIIDASVKGSGWEAVPADVRRQADTAWFRTWLQFDPAAAIGRIDQPILILHGALDTEVPPAHADRLASLSSARRKSAPGETRKVVVPGVNHLLVTAKTGQTDEYPMLPSLMLSPDVASALVGWLKDVLTGR
jgi:fermentation-respiration switch protein FrsA (DUF1100 family)